MPRIITSVTFIADGMSEVDLLRSILDGLRANNMAVESLSGNQNGVFVTPRGLVRQDSDTKEISKKMPKNRDLRRAKDTPDGRIPDSTKQPTSTGPSFKKFMASISAETLKSKKQGGQ